MTEIMPLIPLRGLTVFPNMVIHFDLGREKSITALERAMMMDQIVFLTSQKDPEIDLPTKDDLYDVGVIVKVKQMLKLPGDSVRVLVDGLSRAKLNDVTSENPYFLVSVEKLEEDDSDNPSVSVLALMKTALDLFSDYTDKHPKKSSEKNTNLKSIKQGGKLADTICSLMNLECSESQKLLAEFDVEKRLNLLIEILKRENEISKIESEINAKVKEKLDSNQKEYYLREKIKTIYEELGDNSDAASEASEFLDKLYALNLSKDISEKIEKEIKKYSRLSVNSPDLSVIRTFLETVLELPWNEASLERESLLEAEEILNNEHYGLEKVKERIIEFLAVRKLSKENKAPILCLVGPPGVGKTSIAKSIANATKREFVHMSLGGVRDEAEIRGHRKTYIGAMPGRVMSLIKDCKKNNPVFLFDEIDKIGSDFKGDPASALLEVLDPEQNKEFVDHFLEVPFDLSNVLFITTANDTDTIPRPLLDRMELIELSGYTPLEKMEIASKYLVPKQIKANGLSSKNISISKTAIKSIVDDYTREAGVRTLEKKIAAVCRKVARSVAEGNLEKQKISSKNIEDYLGNKKIPYDELLGKNEVGVATGLAWTSVGGETLFVETAVVPGKGEVLLTGQLGDVMQESAKAAISYVRANQKELGIDGEFYKEKDIHIHVPEGAVPKDGPSAGITMCTSLISALTKRPVRKDVAMTGEISLRGKVLPIGGLKEKALAAHRMGIKKVLVPKDNMKDLDELPQIVKDEMTFVPLSYIEDAIKEALI